MGYFIGKNGKIYIEGTDHPKYDLERLGIENWFHTRFSAWSIRDILEDRFPRIFYDYNHGK